MIEVKIPKEIKEYKGTFLFGLTVKKFISLALALLIGVPLYIFGKNIMPEEIVSWVVMIVVVPIFGIGFVEYHNMTFIQLVQRFTRMIFCPQKRKYTELPVFWHARQQIIADMLLYESEAKKLYLAEKKKMGKSARRKYIILSKNKKEIKK